MIHNIDITGKTFQATKVPEAKMDNDGKQRTDKTTGKPQWSTQVVCFDGEGGTILRISTAGNAPECEVGDEVEPVELVAIPWNNGSRSGVAYLAEYIVVVDE